MGTLLSGLGIAAFTFALTFWYYSDYNQPKITYFSNEKYLHVKEFAVGSLTLENRGRIPDTSLSITIDAIVTPENLSTSLLPSEYTLDILDDETVFSIAKLRPSESIQISFITDSTSENFRISNVISDSGRIENRTDRGIEEKKNRYDRMNLWIFWRSGTSGYFYGYLGFG